MTFKLKNMDVDEKELAKVIEWALDEDETEKYVVRGTAKIGEVQLETELVFIKPEKSLEWPFG